MEISFGKVNITPELPHLLAGFGKKRMAYEEIDPLYAKVMMFRDIHHEFVWITLDVVAIDEELITRIEKKSGISRKNMLISATHTHSGPSGVINTQKGVLKGFESVFGEFDEYYCDEIAERISLMISSLRNEYSPCSLRIFKGIVTDLGSDRHDPDLDCDQDALLLELSTKYKKMLIVRLSCHPTVLNADNCKISADFCGQIENMMDDYDMVSYVNGSCGDMSTRFTRKGNDFEEVKRFSRLVCDQLKKILKQDVKVWKDFDLELFYHEFSVEAKCTDSIEDAEKKLIKAKKELEEAKRLSQDAYQIRLMESMVEGADNNLLMAKISNGNHFITLSLSALKIADQMIVFVPVELFSKLSIPIKKEMNVEFVGYTNGYFLYMPDENAYLKQYYESFSSPFACGSGEKLMGEIKTWLLRGIMLK